MNRIRIVQLSDCHLFGHNDGQLMGVNTRASFTSVLIELQTNVQSIDLILITGDLTQDDSKASYQWLKQQLDKTLLPYFWLAGNHDVPELMHEVCPDAMQKSVQLGQWQLVLLNSQKVDEIPGLLSTGELAFLDQQLKQNPNLHTLIALHHPAYRIDSEWLDKINLQNSQAFWQIIDQYPNVRLVINGHIHQQQERVLNSVKLLSAPSTAIQFKPQSVNFGLDDLAPGYRVIDLLSDGKIQSSVTRLQNYNVSPDLDASGY